MEEWKTYKLGEICTKIGSGATPKGGKEAYLGGDTSLIRSQNVLDFSFSWDGLAYINEDQASKLDGVEIERNDVLLNITGDSVARACIVPDDALPARVNQHVAIIRGNHSMVLNEYILYFLQFEKQNLLSLSQGGATRNALTKGMIENLDILLPELSEQKKIISILKSLDEKIGCNRRINDNLQHQSNALFKSFFIDFEPFREGEFAETELGVIPKNWKILSFGDFIVALTEKAPVDSLPEYSVTNNGIIPRDTKFNKKLSKSSSMNKVLRKNNLVFGMSREILNWGIMEDEIGGVSSAYNIYIIDEDLVDPTYLRLYMKAKISEFNSLIGTAAREGQSLDKGQLMQKKIYVPTKDVLQDFFAHYVPIMESIHNADQESRHLAQLRDALLPKLMSGELKMNDLTL